MQRHRLKSLVRYALREDHASQDITTRSLIPASHNARAVIVMKEPGVVCGLPFVQEAFCSLDKSIKIRMLCKDGQKVKKNTKIAVLEGKTRALLAGERTALNFLGHLSGIATQTDLFVRAVKPSKAKILDTRKTTPGLRAAEKYAVQCGGGENHRFSLRDMVLIKDNHREIFSPGKTITQAIRIVRKQTKKKIEVEVDTLSQFKEALASNPEMILLDNMPLAQMRKAALLKKKMKRNRTLLEASGGITLSRVRAIARSGVDRISIGSLTHSARSVNVSLEIIP